MNQSNAPLEITPQKLMKSRGQGRRAPLVRVARRGTVRKGTVVLAGMCVWKTYLIPERHFRNPSCDTKCRNSMQVQNIYVMVQHVLVLLEMSTKSPS